MSAIHMTEGSIGKHLLRYSIPLILGNLFQLTYNVVDSVIVGRFIGKEALAAVGTAAPVMNLVILGISGICIGASVLMSVFFGAGDESGLRREMATICVFGVYFTLAVCLLGLLFTPALLRALNVPPEILSVAAMYLRITFLGAPFTFFYNALACALKSIGDSKTPLRFLAFASVLNAALDIVLVGYFRMGIVCSAITTVAAQAVSAVLCIGYVYKKIPLLQLSRREFKVDPPLLKKTIEYGGLAALQQACQPVGKLLIQGAVNAGGVDIMAAFSAVTRVDDFAFTPQQSIAQGITTFVAQNRGAGKTERIRKGFITGMTLEFCYWLLLLLTVTALKVPIMHLFISPGDQAERMIALGYEYLSLMAVFYILPAFTNGFQGFFRGMGDMRITLIGTLTQASLRVLFVYLLLPHMGMKGIAYAATIGWVFMIALQIPYCISLIKKHHLK